MEKEGLKKYELTLIISPKTGEDNIAFIEKEIEDNIKKSEGEVKKMEKPKKQELSYPIKKFVSAYYLTIDFLLFPEKIKELLSSLKFKKEIIRYSVLAVPGEKAHKAKKINKPKAISKKETKEIKEGAQNIKKTSEKKRKKIKLEEIDKKLDEILGT